MSDAVEVSHDGRLNESQIYHEREKRRREKANLKPATLEEAEKNAQTLGSNERFFIRGAKVLKKVDHSTVYVGRVKDLGNLIKKYNIRPE